jgi:hypothetical protein
MCVCVCKYVLLYYVCILLFQRRLWTCRLTDFYNNNNNNNNVSMCVYVCSFVLCMCFIVSKETLDLSSDRLLKFLNFILYFSLFI